MSEDEETTLETKGLDQLLKALKAEPPVARIGILGGSPRQKSQSVTNATVGAAHEFGTENLPQRSFLRVPLTDYLNKRIERSGALDEEVMKTVIKTGSVVPWLMKIMAIAEGIVAEAFSSNGFGKWPAWKKGYTSKSGNILVDTEQLRDSITSEVK